VAVVVVVVVGIGRLCCQVVGAGGRCEQLGWHAWHGARQQRSARARAALRAQNLEEFESRTLSRTDARITNEQRFLVLFRIVLRFK
jgi:hypothetical protein